MPIRLEDLLAARRAALEAGEPSMFEVLLAELRALAQLPDDVTLPKLPEADAPGGAFAMPELTDLISTEEGLRAVLGSPAQLSVAKTQTALDAHSRAHIARSPFVLIASSDAKGHLDVSPKGDPPGFVNVLDDYTLGIPDRPGNRRADTFLNVLQNPAVGLLFLVPGRADTLRVNGRAQIARDGWLLDRMIVRGNRPQLALVVQVEEVFFHCAKCVMRSDLWNREAWPALDGLAPLARILADQTALMDEAAMQAAVDESYQKRLY